MALLGCLEPSLEPRATAHIGAMISTIERIIEHGHAYAVDGGDVFFDVASLPGYGRLSGRLQVRSSSAHNYVSMYRVDSYLAGWRVKYTRLWEDNVNSCQLLLHVVIECLES